MLRLKISRFSYLFDSCCSNAPHCLSNSPQVAIILQNTTQNQKMFKISDEQMKQYFAKVCK